MPLIVAMELAAVKLRASRHSGEHTATVSGSAKNERV